MARSLYTCLTEGDVASAAASTAKTIIGVKAGPTLIEICYCTWATNSPGTNSSSTTPNQISGRVLTAGFTSGKTWTGEPTALTVLWAFALDPNKGLFVYDFPLGDSPDSALAEGFAIRTTVASGGGAVNFRAALKVCRN